MKKSVVFAAIMFTTTIVFAQKIKESDIPANVKTAFQKANSNAKDVKWEKENGNYEAEFEIGETNYSVIYDTNANIIETEEEIPVSNLLKQITDYILLHYKEQKIKEASKITDAKGIITYEAEIKNMDLIFDNSGNFIKEIKD